MSLGIALVISSSPLFSGSALGLWLGCECSPLWPAKFCCPLPPVWTTSSRVEPVWGARTEPDPKPHPMRADRKGGGTPQNERKGNGDTNRRQRTNIQVKHTMCVSSKLSSCTSFLGNPIGWKRSVAAPYCATPLWRNICCVILFNLLRPLYAPHHHHL